ncbi:BIR protein, partial [Plasmodium berghei]
MDDYVCRRFLLVRSWFPDQLVNGKYQFISDKYFKEYCINETCASDLEKINAVCLMLLNQFFGSSTSFKYHNNINIVEYIMIWLNYMLNLKGNNDNHISALQHFYTTFINKQEKYTNSINGVTEYKNYKDLIDQKKYFWGMDSNIITNFYEAFKLLCEMYTNFDEKRSCCTNCLQNANKFVNKYKEMNQNSVITSNNSYAQLLSTLLNDYNNFKNYCTSKGDKCKVYPELPTIEQMQASEQSSIQSSMQSSTQTSEQRSGHSSVKTSAQTSEVTSSSSSIGNKLFTVLSIFGAIAFFLGISYK